MRDPDAVQAYEAKQQRLVEMILQIINAHTRDNEKYREIFGKIAACLFQDLTDKRWHTKDKAVRAMCLEIWDIIMKFTNEEHGDNYSLKQAERKYLQLKVFEKVFASVSTGIVGEYQSRELAKEYA